MVEICPNCGRQITEGMKFCSECNANLTQVLQPALSPPPSKPNEKDVEIEQEPIPPLPPEKELTKVGIKPSLLENKRILLAITTIILVITIILSIIGIFLLSEDQAIDTDGDGVPDSTDTDDDNDGVSDVDDAFPLDATEWIDTDGDGVGDNADTDDDNDGVIDTEDAFPLDALESQDTDNDGIGNNADTDDDGDGISDDLEISTYGSNPLNSEDVKTTLGVLLYDSMGEGYKSTRPPNTAYLATTSSETNPYDREITDVIEVALTETMPAVISGDFIVVTSTIGINYVHSTSSSTIEVNSNDLATTINNFDFQNVELDFNALSIVYTTHTFGIGVGEQNDYLWVSFNEIITFYNDVHATGVVLPTNFFDEVEVFNIDLPIDINNFQNAFDIDVQGSQPSFLMIDTIDYKTQEIIEGDAFEVITPEDIASSGYDLLGGNITSTGSNYLINISKNIGEELVTFGESDNTIDNSVMWFILTPIGLYEEKLTGIVELKISEGNLSALEQKIGISFDSSANYPIAFKIGVSADPDPVSNSSYESKEVRELWSKLAEPHLHTTITSVSVNCFAYVVTLEDAMEKLGVNPLAIEIITTFKNPAFAFLIDQNFTDIFGSEDKFLDYTGLAFISDFPSKENLIYFLNITGVLYDTGMFLNSSDLHYPLIVADNYVNNTPDLVEVTLEDLYNNPEAYIGDNLITLIKTDGLAIGTTISTVTQEDYPIDVGVYDLNDKSSGTFYHVPVINISLERGETYLGEHVSVIGFYVNLSKAAEILANSSELAGSDVFSGIFSDIIQNFTVDNEGIKMLRGFIFAYEMVREIIPSNYSISIYAENLTYSGEGNLTPTHSDLSAEIEKSGGDWFNFDIVTVKFVVTSPTSQIFYAYSMPTFLNEYMTNPVYPDLPEPLTITTPIWQMYTVEVYLINIDGFGDVLAYNSTTFSVNTIPSITDVTITPLPAYTDSTLTANPIGWYDPDGDPESYIYQWWKKDALLWETIPGATFDSLDGSNFVRDDLIKVEVTPFDGKHCGASVMSSEIIINNSKPSISSASLSPDPAYTDDTLTVVPNGWYDPDGDPEEYSYQWYNQSGIIIGATSQTLEGSKFTKDDQIYCIVTPKNGAEEGTPVNSNMVTILNRPPTAVILQRPKNPDLTTLDLLWSENQNSDFEKYEVHMSVTEGFTPLGSTLVTTITTQTTTSYIVGGLADNNEYYFIIRVYDIYGDYNDSNEVLGATEYNGDSGDDFSTAQDVSSRKAWSEYIDGTLLGNSVDYFKVYLVAGQKLTVNLSVPTGSDFDLYLYNTTYDEVNSSTGGIDAPEEANLIADIDGYYYIEIFAVWPYDGVYTVYFIIE